MAIHASGAEGRRVYIDQIDEAMQRAARDGKKHPSPRQPRRQVGDIALRRLKDAEKLAKAQRELLTAKADDPEFTRAFNATTKTITNLLETIRRGHEAERKAFAGLSEDQLATVFRSQLTRIAPKLKDEEKRILLTIWFGVEVTEVLLQPHAIEPAAEVAP